MNQIISLPSVCPNHFGTYEEKAVLKMPDHMLSKNGGFYDREIVTIDPCIVAEILGLWSLGIHTYGSCCGHGIESSMVNVDGKDVQLMLNLGYDFYENPIIAEEKGFYPYTFRLNSLHKNTDRQAIDWSEE